MRRIISTCHPRPSGRGTRERPNETPVEQSRSSDRRRAGLAALLGAIALTLVLAATAVASAPVVSTTTFTVSTPELNFECGPYGYGFDVLSTFTVTRRSIQFYDESGNLAKEIRHVKFSGTLYRSDDLTKTIPYAGTWTRTLDVAANTVTNTGLMRYSHPDGSGMVTLDPGRTVFDASSFATPTDTGPTNADWQSGVCAYLARA